MDGDKASQSSKESPDMEEGGKVGFLEEDEGVILKRNPTLQTPGIPAKENVQRKWKNGRDRKKRVATWGASVNPKIAPDNVIIPKAYLATLQQRLEDLEAQHEGFGKSLGNINKLVEVPENCNELVVGIPSKAKMAHSKQVVQLKGEYKKRKDDVDNLVVHIVNENADPNLLTYLKQELKEKVSLIEKYKFSLNAFWGTEYGSRRCW